MGTWLEALSSALGIGVRRLSGRFSGWHSRSLRTLQISFVIAGVFILSADRIPLLRRYAIPGALVCGFGIFIVLDFIVIPLSKAPPLSASTIAVPLLIETTIEHILVIGLVVGIIVRRNANPNE